MIVDGRMMAIRYTARIRAYAGRVPGDCYLRNNCHERLIAGLTVVLLGCSRGGGEASSNGTGEPTPMTGSASGSGASGAMSDSSGSTASGTGSSSGSTSGGSTGSTSEASTGAPLACGNGVLDSDEECDDGNQVWSDGCEPDCRSTHIGRIYAGGYNTCVVFESGRMRCWGVNWNGQLGQGHVDSLGDNELPADVPDIDLGDVKVESVAIDDHTCVVLIGGALRCWGSNMFGELGYGNTEAIGDDEPASVATDIEVGGPVTQVAIGEHSTCALLANGAVRCWGRNYEGQLGYATTDIIGDQPGEMPPPDVDVGGPVVQLASGGRGMCALLADGAVRCWGFGLLGVLGLGNLLNIGDDEHPASLPPVQLGGPAVQLSTNTTSTCAHMASGAVRCFGNPTDGQLGNGSVANTIGDNPGEMPPVDTDIGGELVDVACNGSTLGSATRCFRLAGGVVRCFGNNVHGSLGTGDKQPLGGKPGEMPPPDVDLGGPAIQIACGYAHTCALLADDTVRCWGFNQHGDLGYAHILDVGDEPGEMPPPPVAVF